MITEPRPAFFAVYHVAKDNSIISLNVAHVNDAAISIILTKLRKASTPGAKTSHKIHVEIPLTSMDTCLIRTPLDLKTFFSSVTRNGNFNYVKNKIEQVKSLGYEDNAFSGSFSLPTKTAIRDLVSAMLGEIPSIVVNDLKLTENRFGIEKEIAFSKRAVLSIEIVNKESCDVVFTSHDKKLSANFTCSLAIPQLPNMNEDDFKVLVECDHFSFFVSKTLGIHKIKFSSLGNNRFDWLKLKHIFVLQKIFKQGRFEINCYMKGRKIASGRSDSQLDTAQRTDFTLTITRAIDFLYGNPSFAYHAKFNIDELNKTIKEIKEYFYLIDGRAGTTLEVTLKSKLKSQEDASRLIFPLIFNADGGFLAALLDISGQIDIQECTVIARSMHADLCAVEFSNSRKNLIGTLRSIVKSIAKDSEAENLIVNEDICPSKKHLLSEASRK